MKQSKQKLKRRKVEHITSESEGEEPALETPSVLPEIEPLPGMANKKLAMKLLIDTKAHKVLFAEAGKDVVDFLFTLLGMPVGTIVNLLSQYRMAVGSIGSLYHSLEGLDKAYLQPNCNKTDILNPTVSSPAFSLHNTLLLLNFGPTTAKKKYRCAGIYNPNCNTYFTDGCGTICPSCKHLMYKEMTYVDPKTGKAEENAAVGGEGGGFVKGVVTYTIMDDLTVTPMSTISSITLLNKLQVKDMAALKEKSVQLGYKEGLELLKASTLASINPREKVGQCRKSNLKVGG